MVLEDNIFSGEKTYLEFGKLKAANHTTQYQSSVTRVQGKNSQTRLCTFL